MTPEEFKNVTIGKRYDLDSYPVGNPYQCWDYFAYMLSVLQIPVSAYCAITGYVCDLWRLKETYRYSDYFDFITRPDALITGDWCMWDRGSSHPASHIAMYYKGQELGQNQGNTCVTLKDTDFDILGALRPKFWTQPKRGYAESFSTDFAHTYACAYPLNIRTSGDRSYDSLAVLKKGTQVRCYGYYHTDTKGRIWLYVAVNNLVGFVCMDYLYKVC